MLVFLLRSAASLAPRTDSTKSSATETRAVIIREGSVADKEKLEYLAWQFQGIDMKRIAEELAIGSIARLEAVSKVSFETDGDEIAPGPPNHVLLLGKISAWPTEGPVDDREVVAVIEKIQRETQKMDRTELRLQFPEADDPGIIGKAAEASALDKDIKFEICMKGRGKNRKSGDKKEAPESKKKTNKYRKKKTKEEGAEVIIVKSQEVKTFADLARALKTQVSSEGDGFIIQQVVKTRGGEALLKIKESKRGAASEFSEKLKSNAAGIGADVRRIATDVTLAIRGLDATVETSEVAAALKEVGVGEEDVLAVHLGDLKEGWTGRRTAVVRLPKDQGLRLLRMGKLKVGWARCQAKVTQYEVETCCYRCQKFGHVARDCKEAACDRRKCYRCGSGDHIAKNCTEAVKCYVCGEQGHRADSHRCPKGRRGREDDARLKEFTADRRKRRRAKEVENFENEEEHPPAAAVERGAAREQEDVDMMAAEENEGQQPINNNDQDAPVQP